MRTLARRFSVLLSPAGIHAVEYRGRPGELRIVRYSRDLTPLASAAQATARLSDLLEAEGARGARVALAVAGFGTYHHLLTLPPAPREILLPVVTRELRRFYPDLFQDDEVPLIDFVEIDSSGHAAAGNQKELLAAAVPRALMEEVSGALNARKIQLGHWTIVPRAVQRLHDVFGDPFHANATLLMVPGAPLLGFFHEGELRLFSEPMLGQPAEQPPEIDGVVEQVQRGALFLRQQFRGATVDRLLLAVDPEAERDGFTEKLRQSVTQSVASFGAPGQSPGALVALGASLDARAEGSLNLLSPELRLPTSSERWTQRLAVAGVALFVVAAAWWGWSGLRLEEQARQRLAAVEERLQRRGAAFAAVEPVVRQRQAHTQRSALLGRIRAEHEQLPDMLWVLEAAPSPVQIQRLQLTRSEEGWSASLSGLSRAESSSVASRAVDVLFGELSRSIPDGSVTLDQLAYVDAPNAGPEEEDDGMGAPIAISFQMSFIVPAVEGSSP